MPSAATTYATRRSAAPPRILTRHHGGLRHARMPQQRRLDLARLDAEAAQLHLRVRTAQKLQHAIVAPARQIAGAVHPAPRTPERVRHEPLRRQPRTPQVPARQARARDVQLARNTRRHRRKMRIKDISLVVRKWTANRDV